MADDIDIEEHDVLDNPAIKNMFPDISLLKEEIKNFESGRDPVEISASKKYTEEIGKATHNKVKPVNSVIYTSDDEDDVIEVFDAPEKKTNSNKIILGSKPSKAIECEEEFFEEHVKSYDVNVVLYDMKSYLNSSRRFCKECLILFPSEVGLDSHNQNYHAFTIDKYTTPEKNNISYNLGHKKIKCTKCNVQYNNRSSLYRHNRKIHSGTARKRRIQKIISVVQNNINNKNHLKQNENECFHCKKIFPTQKTLIEHLYSMLQSKKYMVCKVCKKSFISIEKLNRHTLLIHNKSVKELRSKIVQHKIVETTENNCSASMSTSEKEPSSKALESLPCYYRCHICSYYFTETKYLLAHLASKHNVTNHCNEMEKKKFDGLCKYCSNISINIYNYNSHLCGYHRGNIDVKIQEQDKLANHTTTPPKCNEDMKMTNSNKINVQNNYDEINTEPLVLKSAVFKCSKCDIHFLTSNLARNHLDHMEMLINWKCLKCKHIFKKEDEKLHEEQHRHSETFTVHELCPSTSTPVLYKCVKCTVHFDEKDFVKHYLVCDNQTPNSVFCIICDIFIDMTISKSHRSEHVSKSLKQTDFIVVNSDILVKCAVKPALSSTISEKYKNEPLKRKIEETSSIPHKKEKQMDDLLNVTYCHTCKCFLTEIDNREMHILERCYHNEKYVCKICGLVMTAQSYTTVHRDIHNLSKNVKLKDFHFYDINTREQICPPIPEYLKCDNCDVYLISKDALFSHICSETDYLTCHLCDINLSEDAFKLHMLFHNYAKVNVKSGLNNIPKKPRAQLKEKRKQGTPIELKPLKVVLSDIKANMTKELNQSSSKNIKKSSSKVVKAGVKSITKQRSSLKNKSSPNKISTKIKSQTNKNNSELTDYYDQYHFIKETKPANTVNFDGVLYKCRNCRTVVDTYDKVIAHCQGHYCNEEDNIERKECQICAIWLDKTCFESHENLHLYHKNKDYFTILTFDIFYYTSENRIWIEHVFGTLSQEQKDKIIHDSIYKHECRIKMEVIQNGPADLTVYKCDKCRSFINEASLYKHAENSCFKLRRHPCTACGLPFNSSVARIEHEKVHVRPNIDSKSFKIVTFNKEEDESLNKLLYSRSQCYVLYQCRNCSVAVDKSQTKNHKCSERSLKACLACGLLIPNEDFDIHILRHKELPNFIQKNIKIILFGETTESSKNLSDDIIVPSFTGIVYDYTFYSCSKCQVCVKSDSYLGKHTCYFGANRLKCSKCKLYFLTSKLKHHIKLHETNPDFLRDNMRVIIFNSSEEISTNSAKDEHDETDINTFAEREKNSKSISNIDLSQSRPNNNVTNNREEHETTKVEEKCVNIYKCNCGLHFLNHFGIVSHFKICDPKTRVAKQKCAKCDLLFTAEVLFNHLIMHHGSKTQIYKFNILDITKDNFVYRCMKCTLHFAKVCDINEHFKVCNETALGKDCIFCNLKFEPVSFISHNCNNVDNVNASVEVVDLDQPLVPKTAVYHEMQQETPHKESNDFVDKISIKSPSFNDQQNEIASVVDLDEEVKKADTKQKYLKQSDVTPMCEGQYTDIGVDVACDESFTPKSDASYDVPQKQCIPKPVYCINKDVQAIDHNSNSSDKISNKDLAQKITVVSNGDGVPNSEIKQKNTSNIKSHDSGMSGKDCFGGNNINRAHFRRWQPQREHRNNFNNKFQNKYQFQNDNKFNNSRQFQDNNKYQNNHHFQNSHQFQNNHQIPNSTQFQNNHQIPNSTQFQNNHQIPNSTQFQNDQQFHNNQYFQNNHNFQSMSRMPYWRNGRGQRRTYVGPVRHGCPRYQQGGPSYNNIGP